MKDISTQHLKDMDKWVRLIYMALFYISFYLFIPWVVIFISLFQLIHSLLLGAPNAPLKAYSSAIGVFVNQSFKFVTYLSDDKPFPFDRSHN